TAPRRHPEKDSHVLPQRLNPRFIKSRKATAERQEFLDPLLPELRLIVQPTGRKSYVVRTRHRGQRLKLKLADVRGSTDREIAAELDQARTKARDILRLVETGKDPRAADRPASADEKAIENVVAAFIADYRKTHRSA